MNWTYDALQRLTEENYTSTISANNYDDQYVYDVVGNRRSKTHVAGGQTLVIADTYNGNDQIDPLTPETGTLNGTVVYQTTYGYDANGSQTSVTRTGSGAETDAYGYDLQNRLLSATISRTENGQSVTIVASYSYDDSGPRAQSVVTTTIGGGSPITTTRQLVVDADNPTGYTQILEEHTSQTSVPSISYLIGLNVFGQTDGSGATIYLISDDHLNTRLVADSSGNVLSRFAYDAYGNTLAVSFGIISPPMTRILYAGQQFDLALQQYYMRARYYAATTGRFTSSDTFAGESRHPDTFHKYVYAGADPVNIVDPSGHDGELIEALLVSGLRIAFFALNVVQFVRNIGLAATYAIKALEAYHNEDDEAFIAYATAGALHARIKGTVYTSPMIQCNYGNNTSGTQFIHEALSNKHLYIASSLSRLNVGDQGGDLPPIITSDPPLTGSVGQTNEEKGTG